MNLMLYSHLDLSLQINLILKHRRLEFLNSPVQLKFLIFELVKMFSAGRLDASQDDRKKITQIDLVR